MKTFHFFLRSEVGESICICSKSITERMGQLQNLEEDTPLDVNMHCQFIYYSAINHLCPKSSSIVKVLITIGQMGNDEFDMYRIAEVVSITNKFAGKTQVDVQDFA